MSDIEKTGPVGIESHIEMVSTQNPYAEKSEAEKKLVRKQDFLITPLLAGAYFFAYLDRAAIGNARIMGYQLAIGLTDKQYFNCLMMFFLGYMVFEFPAFLLLSRFHAPTVYAVSIIIFGIAGICTAYTTSYAGAMIVRLILGCGEATVQTSFLYLSLWYRREEMATRAGFVYCATPIAGAISGLIAYGVESNLNGVRGLAAWQWLFIIDGVPTVAWGFLVWILLPRLPESEIASSKSLFFGTPEEKRLIRERNAAGHNVLQTKIHLWQTLVAIKDPKTWMLAFIVGTIAAALAAFGVFMPTFISEFGFSPLTSQLYTMIPYACAFVSLLTVALVADRLRKKAIPLLLLTSLGMIGFIVLITTTNKVALVVGACLITAATYPGIVICSAWIPSSHAGYTKRATAGFIAQIFIQCISILSTRIYTKPPRFLKGHGILLGFFAVTFVLIIAMTWMMKRHNEEKDRLGEDWNARELENPDTRMTLEDLCDKHPDYRYVY